MGKSGGGGGGSRSGGASAGGSRAGSGGGGGRHCAGGAAAGGGSHKDGGVVKTACAGKGVPQAAQAHRANQLNPSHATYWSSRGIAPGPTQTVYHGTSAANAASIMKGGFTPYKEGMAGPGTYVTTDQSKAQTFAGTGGVVVRAVANLGNVKIVDARGAREHHYSESSWQNNHDSALIPKGEGVARPEHCVKDSRRVVPVALAKPTS